MSIYLSASLLDDFISCNRKVYYRIHRPEVVIPNREMIIGESVHYTLEKNWDNEEMAYKQIYAILINKLPNDKSALKHAEDCLQTFFHVFREFVQEGDKIERRFKISYEDDVFIVGKMDRISNGKLFDWKTSVRPPKDISGDIQFILYNWAYERLFKSLPSGVYYAALSNGSLIRYKHDEVSEHVLFSEIIPDALSTIRKGNFIHNGIMRGACYRCSFAGTCLEELRSELDLPVPIKE